MQYTNFDQLVNTILPMATRYIEANPHILDEWAKADVWELYGYAKDFAVWLSHGELRDEIAQYDGRTFALGFEAVVHRMLTTCPNLSD